MVETAFGVMDMLFSGFDPQNFGVQVRLGRFDQLLLRPASITLQVLGSEFILRRLGRIVQGLGVLGLAFANLHIHWTLPLGERASPDQRVTSNSEKACMRPVRWICCADYGIID